MTGWAEQSGKRESEKAETSRTPAWQTRMDKVDGVDRMDPLSLRYRLRYASAGRLVWQVVLNRTGETPALL